jgi:hypothetical protein
VAHRLEAAYFYPPDAPKIAAISFGNPLGMMSAVTLGYTGGAALLWVAGVAGSLQVLESAAFTLLGVQLGALVVPAQVVWTLAIAGHLVYAFLGRRDERRLLEELDRSYGPPPAAAA